MPLTKANKPKNAINIAATFKANFIPSLAPVAAASMPLADVGLTSILTFP